jgi:hypothetical protein
MTYNKETYTRNIEISFIGSLIIFILLFYFFPEFDQSKNVFPRYQVPSIEVVHIPVTTQQNNKRPKPNKPIIPVEADELDVLDYVETEELIQNDSSGFEKISGPVLYTELPFTPRQLLDVLPERNDQSVSGLIILSLRIGIDGSVKECKVKKNTTNCDPCLENVIQAAWQSIWEPALIKNHKVEYWIDKSYYF